MLQREIAMRTRLENLNVCFQDFLESNNISGLGKIKNRSNYDEKVETKNKKCLKLIPSVDLPGFFSVVAKKNFNEGSILYLDPNKCFIISFFVGSFCHNYLCNY